LHYAAQGGDVELVKWLLPVFERECHALINTPNKEGKTPLMALFCRPYVASSNYQPHHNLEKARIKIAKILITRGADLYAVNKQGKTALDLARANNHDEIASMLAYAMAAPLYYAALGGDSKHVLALLDKDAALINNMTNEKGNTPLMYMVSTSNYDPGFNKNLVKVAAILIARGADLHIKNKEGETALVLARYYGHTEIATMIETALTAQSKAKPSNPSKPGL
jgi:ankyrin repeat protein